MHDPTLERTTNGVGPVADRTLAELRTLDAGYNFTRDDGRTFPFRGNGITIPTIDEVLERLPDMRFIVEVKDGAAQRGLFAAIDRLHAADRVIAAGMYDRDRTMFAGYRGPRSASGEQLRRFYVAHRLHLARFFRLAADAVQMPEDWNGRRVVSPRLVRDLAAHGIPVHIWTVNNAADMERLLDYGVDGILTDRPDIATPVFNRRFPLRTTLRSSGVDPSGHGADSAGSGSAQD
jgi:glycerophosphoryl diester phosphodiesterase